MGSQGMDSTLRMVLGGFFLVAMLVMVILALTTFQGTPTIWFIVFGILFLVVALVFFFGGEGSGDGAGSGGNWGGSSQQQSIVLGGGGRVITQSDGGASSVEAVCGGCNNRVPENFSFCPECGQKMG